MREQRNTKIKDVKRGLDEEDCARKKQKEERTERVIITRVSGEDWKVFMGGMIIVITEGCVVVI